MKSIVASSSERICTLYLLNSLTRTHTNTLFFFTLAVSYFQKETVERYISKYKALSHLHDVLIEICLPNPQNLKWVSYENTEKRCCIYMNEFMYISISCELASIVNMCINSLVRVGFSHISTLWSFFITHSHSTCFGV